MGSKGVIPSFRGMLPVAPYRRKAPRGKIGMPRHACHSGAWKAARPWRGKGRVWGGTWTIPCSKLSTNHGDRKSPILVLWDPFPKGRFMAHKWGCQTLLCPELEIWEFFFSACGISAVKVIHNFFMFSMVVSGGVRTMKWVFPKIGVPPNHPF